MTDEKPCTEEEGVFLRTVLKKSVHDRLKEFALKYRTGRGDWDYGVAIEILLDWYVGSQFSSISDKLDLIIKIASAGSAQETEEIFEEFLGGHKEKVSKE